MSSAPLPNLGITCYTLFYQVDIRRCTMREKNKKIYIYIIWLNDILRDTPVVLMMMMSLLKSYHHLKKMKWHFLRLPHFYSNFVYSKKCLFCFFCLRNFRTSFEYIQIFKCFLNQPVKFIKRSRHKYFAFFFSSSANKMSSRKPGAHFAIRFYV